MELILHFFRFSFIALFLLFLLLGIQLGAAESAEELWKQLQEMEKGPRERARSVLEARRNTEQHLRRHLELLRKFQREYPFDERCTQVQLRVAQLLGSLSTLTGDSVLMRQGLDLAREIEKREDFPPMVRADAGFTKVSMIFLLARGGNEMWRREAVRAAEEFANRYGDDRRAARVLAEAAEAFKSDIRLRKRLLRMAGERALDEATRARVKDELRQLELLGKELLVEFPLAQGGVWQSANRKGKIVCLVFFSTQSPQSLYWLERFSREVGIIQKLGAEVLLINLDKNQHQAERFLREIGLSLPIAFDGKGWESPLIRELGVNAVPCVWILDKVGRLRTVDASEAPAGAVRELLLQERASKTKDG